MRWRRICYALRLCRICPRYPCGYAILADLREAVERRVAVAERYFLLPKCWGEYKCREPSRCRWGRACRVVSEVRKMARGVRREG